MADYKRQHYVPQFLLRNFKTHGKQNCICVYNIMNSKYIPQASISTQACKDFFYSQNGGFEQILTHTEYEIANTINKVISTLTLPCIGSSEYLHIFTFFSTQRARTLSFITNYYKAKEQLHKSQVEMMPNEVKEIYNEMYKSDKQKEYEIFVRFSLSEPLLYDLKLLLLINKTNVRFLLSDNPVVFFNPLLFTKMKGNSEGIALKGLIIFLPISPIMNLMLYDNNYYGVRNSNGCVNVVDEKDIYEINLLQCINTDSNIFCDDTIQDGYIRNLVLESRRHKLTDFSQIIKPKTISTTYNENLDNCICIDNVTHDRKAIISFVKTKKMLDPNKRHCGGDLIRDHDLLDKVRYYTDSFMSTIDKTIF